MCIKWTIRIREGAVRKAWADTSPDIKQNRNHTKKIIQNINHTKYKSHKIEVAQNRNPTKFILQNIEIKQIRNNRK